jgi:hypothetical protein
MNMSFSSILSNHGEMVDGYVLDSRQFADACREAVRDGLIAPDIVGFHGFVIDLKGQIFKDGICVAFLNKSCSSNELREFIHQLGASLPILDDIAQMVEV